MSGRTRSASATASTPSAASATTSMSGWRSSSSFSPPRTMPWSSAISSFMPRIRMPRAGRVSSIVVPSPGAERTSMLPARRAARARACRRAGAPVVERLGGKPLPSSVTVDLDLGAVAARDRDLHAAGLRVARDVRQRLLHDAVGDELLELAEHRPRPVGGEVRGDAPALAPHPHLRAQRGDEPVVVERRRAQLAREAEQLVHRLRREALGLGELLGELGRRALGGRREAQRHGRQRLVDLVVQVARDARALGLLRAQDRRGAPPTRSVSRRESMTVEGLAQARDVGGLVVGGLRARRRAPRGRRAPSCASATRAARSGGAGRSCWRGSSRGSRRRARAARASSSGRRRAGSRRPRSPR